MDRLNIKHSYFLKERLEHRQVTQSLATTYIGFPIQQPTVLSAFTNFDRFHSSCLLGSKEP